MRDFMLHRQIFYVALMRMWFKWRSNQNYLPGVHDADPGVTHVSVSGSKIPPPGHVFRYI